MASEKELIMISYEKIVINNADDYNALIEYLQRYKLVNDYTLKFINELCNRVGTRCNKLLVEYPYYDSEYLSSYYLFYAKKFKSYDKKSCRVHFFKNEQYYGCITVRPLLHYSNIGKSFIDPSLLLASSSYIMLSPFRIHILGVEQYVNAFPWMNQQKDFSMCAHVAVWSILKHFGNAHTGHRDLTVGEIVENIAEQANRKLPSTGLNLRQIADIFKHYQLTPIIKEKEVGEDYDFFREILAYVESGIPLVAVSNKKEHAVAVIGHGHIDYDRLKSLSDVIDHQKLINSLIISDDNMLPYYEAFYDHSSTVLDTESKDHLSVYDFDYIIIPLYERVHLEYAYLYNKVKAFLNTGNLQIEKDVVIRVYLASANSIKKGIALNESVNAILKSTLLRLEMPKFCWCVDISSKSEYVQGYISARLIIDSTASADDDNPWLLIHDGRAIKYYDGEWLRTEVCISPYRIFNYNLEEIVPCL